MTPPRPRVRRQRPDPSDLLKEHRPRILLFIGHADATHPYAREYTLGLTDEAGGLVRLLPETLVDVLSSAELELVVLNGCESEALGAAVAKAADVPVVCWRTKLLDEAAALYSPALFEHLLHPSRAAAPLRQRLPPACKQAELAIKKVHGNRRR